jgi:transcriptional regulator with XRE-family HTH domain
MTAPSQREVDARAFHRYATRCLGTTTQRKVADVIGISPNEYSAVLHGRRGVSVERFHRWCHRIAAHAGHHSFVISLGDSIRFRPVPTEGEN